MAGKFSDFLKAKLMDHVFGNVPYEKPQTVYLGLMTSPGTGSAPGLEIVGNGYARQPIVFAMDDEYPGTVDNPLPIQFPPATGAAWGVISDWALFDADTGGNMLVYGGFAQPKEIHPGDRIELVGGAFVIGLN